MDRLKMSKAVVVGDLNVGKTCLINRFCKDVFNRDYKATIGVDFEIERFELSGLPYSLQIWDTAGQEKFKCIASAYYRGAQVIITVFDMADIKTLEHTRQWLMEALGENEPNTCFMFLVGTKRDLLSAEECQRTERDAVKMASEMNAEFWSVSSKTGENVQEFFFRVAALAFEDAVLKDMELGNCSVKIGDGGILSKPSPALPIHYFTHPLLYPTPTLLILFFTQPPLYSSPSLPNPHFTHPPLYPTPTLLIPHFTQPPLYSSPALPNPHFTHPLL
ncbi:hypothetical protein P4O66_005566 [Electrophorus voltai]|uniref:Ras-related protein Rab-36 n=1 Tax=Electrophorus voltai TaxID=2609070 RepID=A0AAD8ZKX5_9TELE|nr:hypothetical protein P4O66_005566 [Electrophorus voltai]